MNIIGFKHKHTGEGANGILDWNSMHLLKAVLGTSSAKDYPVFMLMNQILTRSTEMWYQLHTNTPSEGKLKVDWKAINHHSEP